MMEMKDSIIKTIEEANKKRIEQMIEEGGLTHIFTIIREINAEKSVRAKYACDENYYVSLNKILRDVIKISLKIDKNNL